jgi:hypothetical protein
MKNVLYNKGLNISCIFFIRYAFPLFTAILLIVFYKDLYSFFTASLIFFITIIYNNKHGWALK